MLLLFSGAWPARAADRTAPPGRFQLGPLYLSPSFELRNLGQDTNVFNSGVDPVQDLSIVMRPATTAAVLVGDRLRITGAGYVDLNYFGRSGTERSADYGGHGRLDLTLGRLTLFGAAGGLNAKQRFSIDLDARVPRREPWWSVGLGGRLTSRLSTTLSLTRHRYDFDQTLVGGVDIEEALDRDSRTGTVDLRYELTRKTSLAASFDTGNDRFTKQTGAGRRQVHSERYMGGFVFGERAVVSGRAMFGMRRFPDTGGQLGESGTDFRRPAFAVNASTGFLGSGRLTAIVDRDVFYGTVAVRGTQDNLQNAYVFSNYRLEALMELPADLIGRWSCGFEKADYVRPTSLGPGRSGARREHQWTVSAAALKPLGRHARLGVSATWSRRTSTLPGNSFSALRYGLQGEFVP